jgi:carboxyl-terminal processing protease
MYNPEDLRTGFERFKQTFTVPQDLLDILFAKAKEEKIEYTDSAYQATLPMLREQLKALVARDLFDMSEYFEIINPTNEIYQRGLEALKNDESFQGIRTQ